MEQPSAPDERGDSRQRSDEPPRLRDYDYFSDIGPALRNDPRAAYAFAALMYRISELTKINQEVHAFIAPLAESGIRLGYEYTTDHEACLMKFKHTLAEE
ncbi:MAG TPA: hypothetical protein VJ302_15770 [Blastocatellia bacterium]|nr:hypothetical protein [Blastocatellia bacterium]